MALRDRLVRILGSSIPVVGGAAFVVVLLILLWPMIGPLVRSGSTFAWVVGIAVAAYALGHLTIKVHVRGRANTVRNEHGELSFPMAEEVGPPVSTHPEHSERYSGRSHTGERPRFD